MHSSIGKHYRLYSAFAILLVPTGLVLAVYWLPLAGGWYYGDGRFPKVTKLVYKDGKLMDNPGEFRYLNHKDGVVILRRTNSREFVMIRDDSFSQLDVESRKR